MPQQGSSTETGRGSDFGLMMGALTLSRLAFAYGEPSQPSSRHGSLPHTGVIAD